MKKNERAEEIIRRYKSGETLQQIGSVFDVSRERVRQILKELGIDPLTGGALIRRFLLVDERVSRKREIEKRRELHALRFWAISSEEYTNLRALHGYRPFAAFIEQRKNAKARGISWRITFRDWWDCWQSSGRWSERGKGNGYCMGRVGDSGPYAIWNVYICTGVENLRDQRRNMRPQQENSLST